MKEKWAEIEKKLIEKAWQDDQFRKELITNPKKVIEQELGCALPANINVKVVEETADTFYFRLPVNPNVLPDEALDKVAGGCYWDDPCPNQTCQH
ncbi:NHLP leader peptide family RiPP precursor [Candidatus Formimonas warabiya]|uniref:Nitrile hydratase alpha/Thiocyanate hydrolase gamma domain-containing protein n=1 Tax=Formimonas warabiya TaxID=1761012 RepID=A0A3G1KZ88_FORW1|nr:NHLP leader peptide family RiPP precursor [Candidatus Formimonas warabiya]ATW27846.1 hypothetical protein DCMF_26590 [Candidatus Formimonas warabiya]